MSQDLLIAPPLPNASNGATPPPLPSADKAAAKAQDKAVKMGEAGKLYAARDAAQAALDAAEKAASDYVLANLFKSHGPGPHKITVDNQEKIVTFQQVNKAIRARFLDLDKVT